MKEKNAKANRMQLMSEGNVSKALLKLGIPMVVSMLVMALYNVVDTYFVSGLGTQQVGAVSVAFPISLIFSAKWSAPLATIIGDSIVLAS